MIRALLTILLSVVVVSSCAQLMAPASLPGPTPVTTVQQAQAAINEANLMIIATSRTAWSQLQGQIISAEEYDAIRAQLVDYANKVDAAQDALDVGAPNAAQQAQLLNGLVLALQKQIAQKARSQ